MYPWNCCRTCLGMENLNPIFPEFGSAEKYSDAVFSTTGLLVDPNDYLPQQMCSMCIEFINKSKEFRKKAIATHKELLKRLQSCMNGTKNVIIEPKSYDKINEPIKAECILVDEKDELDKFSDDDDITLNHFKSVDNFETSAKNSEAAIDIVPIENGETELNSLPDENTDYPKIKQTNAKKSLRKRKPRVKKSETADNNKERVKERIECEICHKILTSKLSIRNHSKIHTGFDVVCEHCGKKFITRRLLMQHCRAKHGYEKTDKCSYCDYRGSNAEQVKIHERLHTGEKPFKCTECDNAFHRRSTYQQHAATHLKDPTVPCPECPKRFKSVTLMRIHRYRHRPPAYSFRCGVCGRSFARRRNVAKHVALLHRADPAANVLRVKNQTGLGT